jgi:hypothetical protein
MSEIKKFRPAFGSDFISKIFTANWEVKTHILGMS